MFVGVDELQATLPVVETVVLRYWVFEVRAPGVYPAAVPETVVQPAPL